MLLGNSHLVLHPLKTPEELKWAFPTLKFHLITLGLKQSFSGLTTLKKRHEKGPHGGDLEAKAALPAIQCVYGRGKPLQITVCPALLSSGHRTQEDSCSLCTQPVKPLASMYIQQHLLEQQQLSRASASTPTSTPPRCPCDILTPWRPAAPSTSDATSSGRSSPQQQLCRPVVAAVLWTGVAVPQAHSCRAERSCPCSTEHPPRARLPWPLQAVVAILRRATAVAPGAECPLLWTDRETLTFCSRLRRFSPGGEWPPKAPCDSEAEGDGAGGERRALCHCSP